MPDGAVRTKGIEPQPVPLNLKVVLIGNEELYEALLTNDDRFAKLFKIKAHMTETVERTAADIRSWLIRVAGIIDETQSPAVQPHRAGRACGFQFPRGRGPAQAVAQVPAHARRDD